MGEREEIIKSYVFKHQYDIDKTVPPYLFPVEVTFCKIVEIGKLGQLNANSSPMLPEDEWIKRAAEYGRTSDTAYANLTDPNQAERIRQLPKGYIGDRKYYVEPQESASQLLECLGVKKELRDIVAGLDYPFSLLGIFNGRSSIAVVERGTGGVGPNNPEPIRLVWIDYNPIIKERQSFE